MELTDKIKRVLSSDKWYHATTIDNYNSIRQKGIIADFNRGKELDFGYGFYFA